MASTCAATFSASWCENCSPSAWITLATPAICAAALAASAALWPATSTCTSPPHWAAAVTVFRVAPRMDALSCSAMTRAAMSNHLCFSLQLGNQRRHIRHLDACLAARGLRHLQGLQARLHVHAQVGGRHGVELLLFRLHDVGQRHVARLV